LTDPAGTIAANVDGTRNLLELSREKNALGFLFFSTSEVYGNPDTPMVAESEPGRVDPLSETACYQEGKRLGESLCAAWHRQYGVRAVSARIFHTYGPGMAPDDGRVFADLVADIVAGRELRLRSAGTAVRSFCYLSDATAAYLTLLLEGAGGEAYNVGNDDAVSSVSDLADSLVNLFPDRKLKVSRPERSAPERISRIVPDTAKLRGLGWTPVHGIESGFSRTVESYS
jgi:dTDP-glucose 4,6-dehydratase